MGGEHLALNIRIKLMQVYRKLSKKYFDAIIVLQVIRTTVEAIPPILAIHL